MNPLTITVMMFSTMFLFLLTGIPISFALGAVAMGSAFWLWGAGAFDIVIINTYHVMSMFMLVAIPLFLFMGIVMQKSGVADDLFDLIHQWMGSLRGGLAVGTVFICTVLAAMVGVSGAATVAMGIIALPAMLKRGYNKRLSIGSIQAGGALGALIPPSIGLIVYAMIAQVSVGTLFLGAIIPGLILSSLYVIYILARCFFQPDLAPALPPEERFCWRRKVLALRALVLPLLVIVVTIGSIVSGAASPTEASAIGAAGSLVCAAVHKKINKKFIMESTERTLRITGMVMWIVIAALCFSKVYTGLGGSAMVANLLANVSINRWLILVIMQASLFVFGCFLDDTAICFISVPVYVPIIVQLGFDPVWFGVLFVMNMQMGYLTPPFGYNLFYLKGVAPREVTMMDIYGAVWPFVLLQGIGLGIVMIFSQTVLWAVGVL